MNINFFLKRIIILFFVFITLFFSQLALCENQTNTTNDFVSNTNLNLAPMLRNIMPSIVRVITSYHDFHGRYFYNASEENKIDNSLNLNQNNFKYKNFFNKNKLLKIYKKYTFSHINSHKLGSGVIIDSKNAYVITNYHVIHEAFKIDVYLTNGKIYNAKLVGKSRNMDLALLQLCDADNLKSINIADFKTVHIGDYAIAIGSPYNLKNSVSFGVVSALRRHNEALNLYDDFIQTDAAINHGNSGGPLVNTKGELIGINTSVLSDSDNSGNIGIGFSIPTNTILRFVEQIKKNGEYHQGELGILATQLNDYIIDELNLSVHHGILINSVQENSAAQKSGLFPGDIIISVNKRKFHSMFTLRYILKDFVENDVIYLKIIRNNQYITKKIKLKYYPSLVQHAAKFHYKLDGVLVKVYDLKKNQTKLKSFIDYYTNNFFTPNINGIIIKNINKHSFAKRSGLCKDDIIISVNHVKVDSMESFKKALSIYQNIIILEIFRQTDKIFYIIF